MNDSSIPAASTPEISVVLATSSLRAARQAIEAFHGQTAAGRIELLVVAPRAELDQIDFDAARELGALRAVESESPFELAPARARGVLTASAPWVFIGETHSFADPTLIARLLAAIAETAAGSLPQAFVACIYNVNPSGAVSWASFLIDYGAWGPGLAAGTLVSPPIYNGLFQRSMLELHGADLRRALLPHDDAVPPMPAGRGYRAIFTPAARIGHLNVVRLSDFARSKCQLGMAVGEARGRRWGWPRRLAYAAASPLIAVVLFSRYLPVYQRARREDPMPAGVLPLLGLGALVRAAGEAVGYLGWSPASLHARIEHLEVFKIDYVPGWSG